MWIICEYNFYLKLRCSYFFYLSVSVVYFFTIFFCVCLFVLPQESLRSFVFVFDAVVLRRVICMEHKISAWNTKPISALLFLFLITKGRISDVILDVQVKHVQRDMKCCFAFFAF